MSGSRYSSSQHTQGYTTTWGRTLGTHRNGGWLRRFASTLTRARGTRTPATATTEGCSSWPAHTAVWADDGTGVLTLTLHANNSTGRSSFTYVTGAPGASGGQRDCAGSGNGATLDELFVPISETEKYWQARTIELDAALRKIAEKQPEVLGYIEANGFVFESIGKEPGNWQHLAFSIYTDLCEIDVIARAALELPYGE